MPASRHRIDGFDARAVVPDGYGLSIAICLPRDELSVPVIRHLVRHALDEVGVLDAISGDIEVALTEACANVLHHAGPGDSYEVVFAIGPDDCELRVVDVGRGFDHMSIRPDPGANELHEERGRGLRLMHALVDRIELVSAPEEGTLVRLVKRLAFDDSAPARRLLLQALHQRADQTTRSATTPYPSDTVGLTATEHLAETTPDRD
jgi:serine/threonine-protein kinase RsbW